MHELLPEVREALVKRGFHVHCVQTGAEARQLLLSLIPQGASIGVGGSMTLREMDMYSVLTQAGHKVYWHWYAQGADAAQITAESLRADVYLASSNAVTRQGQIVNIDGTGNRVTGMFFGPKKVFLVISEQKIVDGGVNTAIARIKRHACPPNARRLNLDTPCARTGICDPSQCGDACMCRVTTVLDRPSRGREVTVIFVEEMLGY